MENNGILKSFDLQDELNSKIWIKTKGDNYVISQKVREKLLEIAYEFIEFLNVDIIVSDVHLTGSLANYNWSEYSDFDLHIIADFDQFPKNKLDLYKELLTLKKTIFNSDQNIKIYGYDVELYAQDENEEHTSTGVYSLISNDWVEKPKKENFEVDKSVLKKKIDQWTEKIDKILESAEEEKDLQKSKKIIDNLKTKIKEYRKIGLDKGGEMSYENLVFKYLRRSGHIEKLFSFKKERVDKDLSIKESANELRGTLDNLGYDEKNSELTSGGEISGEISSAVSTILTNFKQIDPDAKVRVTAGNDKFHQGRNSKHPKGLAIDLTIEPSSSRSNFISVLNDYKKTNSDFSYIDEYTNPSKGSTGGHFHLQIGKGSISTTGTGIQSNKLKELVTKSERSGFMKSLKDIALSGKEFKYVKQPGRKIQYQSEVEKLQIGLQFLGYSLPKWGVDGLFGPETKKSVESFQEDNKLTKTGVLNSEDLKYFYALLVYQGFEETDLSKIKYDEKLETSDIPQTGPISSNQVISFFVSKGLTPEQSAAITGNLYQESNLNPSALNNKSGAFGLAQWYKTRFDGLKEFMSNKNMELSNPIGQLEYIWRELQTTENSAFIKFMEEKNISGMVRTFAKKYERMGVFEANMSKRIKYAKQFLNQYSQLK
jgi:peptidoglycan hydrolase-like protein with peptidoglycan-binding domain/predicted nucleotidyltransferase